MFVSHLLVHAAKANRRMPVHKPREACFPLSPFYMVAPRNSSKIAPSLQSVQLRSDRARRCARHHNIGREKTGEDINR